MRISGSKVLIALVLASGATAVCANVCQIRSGQVELGGAPVATSGGERWIEQCSGALKIVSPEAEICLFNELQQWSCKAVPEGEVEIAALEVDGRYGAGFLEALKSLFDPEVEQVEGGMRLREGEELPGMPAGAILMPETALVLFPARAAGGGVESFTLARDGQQAFAATAPGEPVVIPAASFQPGGKYQWRIETAAGTHAGTFSIVGPEDQAEFEQDFADLQGAAGLDGSARILMRGVLAREYGYTFDHQNALDQIRHDTTTAKE